MNQEKKVINLNDDVFLWNDSKTIKWLLSEDIAENLEWFTDIYKKDSKRRDEINECFSKDFWFDKTMRLYFDWDSNLFAACVRVDWDTRTLLNSWSEEISLLSELQIEDMNYNLIDIKNMNDDFSCFSAKFQSTDSSKKNLSTSDLAQFLWTSVQIWDRKYEIVESRNLMTWDWFLLKFKKTQSDWKILWIFKKFF